MRGIPEHEAVQKPYLLHKYGMTEKEINEWREAQRLGKPKFPIHYPSRANSPAATTGSPQRNATSPIKNEEEDWATPIDMSHKDTDPKEEEDTGCPMENSSDTEKGGEKKPYSCACPPEKGHRDPARLEDLKQMAAQPFNEDTARLSHPPQDIERNLATFDGTYMERAQPLSPIPTQWPKGRIHRNTPLHEAETTEPHIRFSSNPTSPILQQMEEDMETALKKIGYKRKDPMERGTLRKQESPRRWPEQPIQINGNPLPLDPDVKVKEEEDQAYYSSDGLENPTNKWVHRKQKGRKRLILKLPKMTLQKYRRGLSE